MRTFQKIVFLVGMFILVPQFVRHVYLRLFEKRTSVLDTYKKEVEKEAEQAESLHELLVRYDPARKRIDELNEERRKLPTEEERERFEEAHEDEYHEESHLRYVIEDWEGKSEKIRELRVFWGFGFLFLVIGGVLYWRRYRWLGMCLVIPGFVEMIWWTSPSFQWLRTIVEFDRLLNNKIFFTTLTLALLVGAWLLLRWTYWREDAETR